MAEDKYGYHRSFCDYCERITDHEGTQCMCCKKFDGETVSEYLDGVDATDADNQ